MLASSKGELPRAHTDAALRLSSQEYFADYIPITPSLFSLGYSAPPSKIWGPTPNSWDGDALRRHTEGLTALLLSLKKKPIVRYERMSALAKKLAEDVVVSSCREIRESSVASDKGCAGEDRRRCMRCEKELAICALADAAATFSTNKRQLFQLCLTFGEQTFHRYCSF